MSHHHLLAGLILPIVLTLAYSEPPFEDAEESLLTRILLLGLALLVAVPPLLVVPRLVPALVAWLAGGENDSRLMKKAQAGFIRYLMSTTWGL